MQELLDEDLGTVYVGKFIPDDENAVQYLLIISYSEEFGDYTLNDYTKEEIVDMLHFLVSMALRSGMDAEEMYQRYLAKNQENFDRQHGKSRKEGYDASEAKV